jgi:predicted transcriptional regulator
MRLLRFEATMTKLLEQVIEQLRKLPEAEQDEAAELLVNLIARGNEPIELDADTRSAVEEGLAQVKRGEVVSQEQMEAFFRRLGV